MAFTDLTVANGWIPVQYTTDVLAKDQVVSAVEQAARKVNMTTDQTKIPRFAASGVDVVAEGATIPLKDATLDDVILDAFKFADRFAVSSEDAEDSIVDAFNAFKNEWLGNFAVTLDNACLGVTGTGGPFNSVYREVGAGNRQSTAGNLTYEHLVEAVGELETSRKGGLVIIAHPEFAMSLRNLKDADGDRVVDTTGVLGAGVPTVFGHDLVFSHGAKTSATYTDAPAGNALLVVAAKRELILGVRSGPEARVSEHEQWANDNLELKMRARRAFVLASADGARVIEKTASA
jgi:HK97 family phage major capsid protein